jgi:hypothetical protein
MRPLVILSIERLVYKLLPWNVRSRTFVVRLIQKKERFNTLMFLEVEPADTAQFLTVTLRQHSGMLELFFLY